MGGQFGPINHGPLFFRNCGEQQSLQLWLLPNSALITVRLPNVRNRDWCPKSDRFQIPKDYEEAINICRRRAYNNGKIAIQFDRLPTVGQETVCRWGARKEKVSQTKLHELMIFLFMTDAWKTHVLWSRGANFNDSYCNPFTNSTSSGGLIRELPSLLVIGAWPEVGNGIYLQECDDSLSSNWSQSSRVCWSAKAYSGTQRLTTRYAALSSYVIPIKYS